MKNFLEYLAPGQAGAGASLASGTWDASKFAALQARYFKEQAELLQSALGGAAERGSLKNDQRFSSPEWRNPWFDYLRRSFLVNAKFVAD